MKSLTLLYPRKPAFERALAALAHPISLAALVLMLFNDTLLRRWWPSWWTGKLSDLAWLVIVPLVLAMLLGLLVPARREKWAFGLSMLLCGLGFSLVKIVPAFNVLAARLFAGILQQAPALTLDPSDLLALPGLAIAAWVWAVSGRGSTPSIAGYAQTNNRIDSEYEKRSVRGLVVLPLAALLLLADSPAPNLGVICFARDGSAITAGAGYNTNTSTDGGLTWSSRPGYPGCQRQSLGNGETVDVPGPKEGEVYRFKQGAYIELSTDGGQNFKQIYQVEGLSEPESLYYIKTHAGNPMVLPGPFSAIADSASGNMLFAMGQEGVLVRKPDGAWVWSSGGGYQHIAKTSFPNAEAFQVLLSGMVGMAVVLALLIYSSLALRWTFHWLRLVILILAWLAWLGVDILFPPASNYDYGATFGGLGIAAAVLLALPLAIEQTVRLARRAKRSIPILLGVGLLGGLLYVLPYVLWLYGTLARLDTATLFALVVSAVVLAVGFVLFLRKPVRVG